MEGAELKFIEEFVSNIFFRGDIDQHTQREIEVMKNNDKNKNHYKSVMGSICSSIIGLICGFISIIYKCDNEYISPKSTMDFINEMKEIPNIYDPDTDTFHIDEQNNILEEIFCYFIVNTKDELTINFLNVLNVLLKNNDAFISCIDHCINR